MSHLFQILTLAHTETRALQARLPARQCCSLSPAPRCCPPAQLVWLGRRQIRQVSWHSDGDLTAAWVRAATWTAETGAKGEKLMPKTWDTTFLYRSDLSDLGIYFLLNNYPVKPIFWMLSEKSCRLPIVLCIRTYLHKLISLGRMMLLPFCHLTNPPAVWLHPVQHILECTIHSLTVFSLK